VDIVVGWVGVMEGLGEPVVTVFESVESWLNVVVPSERESLSVGLVVLGIGCCSAVCK